MTFARFVFITLALMALLVSGAEAALVVQSFSFDQSFGPFSGTDTVEVIPSGSLTASVAPFDSGLGTLTSFRITWSFDFSGDFTCPADVGCGANASGGGSFFVNSSNYNGDGGGNGTGDAPGGGGSFAFSVGNDTTFLPALAGITYDPAILAAVVGPSNYSAGYDAGFSTSYNAVATYSLDVLGSLTVTYDYVGFAAVPAPATLLLLAAGLVGGHAIRGGRRGSRSSS